MMGREEFMIYIYIYVIVRMTIYGWMDVRLIFDTDRCSIYI